MNAGRLSDRIRFDIRIVEVVNGQNVPRWVESFHEYAEATRTSETTARFSIRYNRRGITPATHRILWDGITWAITSAIHDRKRMELVIETDAAGIEVTTLESTEREFIEELPLVSRPEQ